MELIITTENPATLEAIKELLSAFSDVKFEYRKGKKRSSSPPIYKADLLERVERINNGTAKIITFDNVEAAKEHFLGK